MDPKDENEKWTDKYQRSYNQNKIFIFPRLSNHNHNNYRNIRIPINDNICVYVDNNLNFRHTTVIPIFTYFLMYRKPIADLKTNSFLNYSYK